MPEQKMHITRTPRMWTLEELWQAHQSDKAQSAYYADIINREIINGYYATFKTDKKELLYLLGITPKEGLAHNHIMLCLKKSILSEISLADTEHALKQIEAACLPPDGHKNGGWYTSDQGIVWEDYISLGIELILPADDYKAIHEAIKKRLAALKRKAKAEEKRRSENLIIVANMTFDD